MANNLNQSMHSADEIDLKGILNALIESKKIIISTLLFFTIASIIYSLTQKPSFESSVELEIGYFKMPDGSQKLIEESSDLISDLRILIMKNPSEKFIQKVSINSFEKKIIVLNTSSSSVEKNENLLTEIINYTNERHSNLALLVADQKKLLLSNEIDLIKSEISFYKSQNLLDLSNIESEISILKEDMRNDIEAKISKLKSDLPVLEQEIGQIKTVVIEDSNNLKLLQGTTYSIERAAISPTLEQIISSYKSNIIKLTRERNKNIADINILSQKLDALKKNTFQSYDLLKLEKRKKELENPTLQSFELLALEQRLKNTKNQLQMLMSQNTTQTSPLTDIETATIKPKTLLLIFFSIIFGFFASIVLVFTNNFIKEFRQSEA
jgi:hypothetical protein